MEAKLINIKRCLAITVIIAVAVLLLTSSCTVNYPPTITRLEAEADWTYPLGNITVICDASDPEGDALSYGWSANGGSINGTGSEVIWTAPEEVGMYDITVVVEDNFGRKVAGAITLTASNGTPPIIENLFVTATHKYLKKTTNGYKVAKTYSYNIECIALNTTPGELLYAWSCTGGKISGNSSLITWTAPNTEGYFTVTVKVFDVIGNWVRKSIVFEVVHCVSCEPW